MNATDTDLKIPEKKEGSEKIEVPESRIVNLWQAWSVCNELEQQDEGRAKKRSRIFKAYSLFPPSDYSTLFVQGNPNSSNVPFGMLRYRVNNTMSSFIDMVTERHRSCEIRTKKGNYRERSIWSDCISDGFEKVLNKWDERLLNTEQGITDMLLYSKGIEAWEDKEGCTSCHVPCDDLLVPDGTKVSFANFDLCAIKKKYTLHELWEKIEDGVGWNEDAVIKAMMNQREAWGKLTMEDWLHKVKEGDIFLGGQLKEHVDCYILYVREFRRTKISKFVLLRSYGSMLPANVKEQQDQQQKADGIIEFLKKQDFLFQKVDYEDKITDIFSVFMDSAGSGKWHNIPSLAESIFVQCRQYDFVMNAVMDAVRINMCLMVQATTADAEEKLKELIFGSFLILPTDVPFVQQRVALPTTEATQTIQFIMLDMFQGIGEYRVQERAKGGEAQTATQANIDAATTAKLTGTQLKRYAAQEKLYYRNFYKRLVQLNKGEKDYELLECFKEYLKESGVPDSAWKWENIDSITTNVLAGAGSPAYKVNAAMKTIEITNISPKSEGQFNAMQDAVAAFHGRDQVQRYLPNMMPDKSFNERLAGYEDSLLSNIFLNPKDVQVNPDDQDEYHLNTHLTDMERTIAFVNEKLKDGSLTESMGEGAAYKLLNQGAHCLAHIENASRDKSKQDIVKAASRRLNVIQGLADKMAKDMQGLKGQKKQQQGMDPTQDPDVQKKVALSQIEIESAQKKADIKHAAAAASHQQKMEINQDKGAQDIAIARAKAKESK